MFRSWSGVKRHESRKFPFPALSSPNNPFLSPEAILLLVSTKSRDLLAGPTLKSLIHELTVKSDKSDCLRIRNEYSAHTQKIRSSQRL